MVGPRHDHFAVKSLHGIVDAVIIRGYKHGVQRFGCLLINATDNGLSAYLCERFTREAGGAVTRRYDSNKFHIIYDVLFTIYNLTVGYFATFYFGQQVDSAGDGFHIGDIDHSSAGRDTFLVFLFVQQAS